MATPRVTVVMVAWNSAFFLPECLLALRAHAGLPYFLQVVDNASSDGSVGIVRELAPDARVLSNVKNVGFCRAVNQGIKLARTDYVLLLTSDVALREGCLAALVAFADQHLDAGSCGPVLVRRAPEQFVAADAHQPPIAARRVDSLGMRLNRRRIGYNLAEGSPLESAPSRPVEVFGCSGACVLYRRRALETVALDGEFLDEDFFTYKEDVDLAWRLRLAGFSAWCVPTALADHVRRLRQPRGSWRDRLRQRRAVPRRLRQLSFKNQQLMLVKNEQWPNMLWDLPWLTLRWGEWLLLSLTLEPFLWRTLPTLVRQLPAAWRKRGIIQRHAKVTPAQIRRWFTQE